MKRILATLVLSAIGCAATANADEQIVNASNLESLTLAVAHSATDLQSRDTSGTSIANRVAGPQIAFGYANTRTRSVLGVPGFYTRYEFQLGLGRQDFVGSATDPVSGAVVASKGPFDVQTAVAEGRVGYGWSLGPGGRVSLTPFIGFAPQISVREPTAVSGATVNFQYVIELGLLAQTRVAPGLVLGADASVGRFLGAWQVDHYNLLEPEGRMASTFSLYLDHRTDADSHERIVLRQGFQRFGDPAQSTGSLEPRRNSTFTFMLEFGTEGNLFEQLFH